MLEIIIFVFVLFLICQTLYLNIYEMRIYRNVSGPLLLPIVTNIPYLIGTDFGQWIGDCFKKYGNSFFISHCFTFWGLHSKSILFTQDPQVVKFMNTNLDIFVRLIPGQQLETLLVKQLFGDGIFFSDGDNWCYLRHIARPMFKKENINKMRKIFHEKSETVLQILEKKKNSGSIFNSIELFSAYTLDSFCKIAFGTEVNSLHQKVPFQNAFDGALKFIMDIFVNPIAKYTRRKEFEDQLSDIDSYIYGLIDNNTGNGSDILSTLKNGKDDEGKPFPRKWIRDILCNFLIAGRDTTALLITWTFYYLALNPSIEKKLVEELKQACTGPILSDESIANCKYLDMVINETLRLSPSVPATYRFISTNVTLPNGTKLYKGDSIGYSQYYMHRNPEYWDNPEQYLPERWEDKKLLSNPSFIPFHSGEMQCLGRYMAKVEAKALISSILLHYHLELVPGKKEKPFFGLVLSVPSLNMTVQSQM